jgi:hypothetical protein
MLQERFFRPARVLCDMPAKLFAHLRLFRPGLGENRLNDRRHLPAKWFEILLGPRDVAGGSEGPRLVLSWMLELQQSGPGCRR